MSSLEATKTKAPLVEETYVRLSETRGHVHETRQSYVTVQREEEGRCDCQDNDGYVRSRIHDKERTRRDENEAKVDNHQDGVRETVCARKQKGMGRGSIERIRKKVDAGTRIRDNDGMRRERDVVEKEME